MQGGFFKSETSAAYFQLVWWVHPAIVTNACFVIYEYLIPLEQMC